MMRCAPRGLGLTVAVWLACFGPAAHGATPRPGLLDKVCQFIPPLEHARHDRLPILLWQSQGFPTGLENGTVRDSQAVFLDRGLMPLCNPVANEEQARQYLPVFRTWQERGFPVCILAQGWMQTVYTPDKNGRLKCAHKPPAEPSAEYPCAAATQSTPRLPRQAETVSGTLRVLRDSGIKVRLLVIDFESGLYLRHQHAAEANVLKQAEMARRCPACAAAFGREELDGPAAYSALADRVRADATRRGLCEPAREVFPGLAIGNFFAWPINRVARPEGTWPAYGVEQSGMNVAMPSMYMNAGWRGAGRDQAKMNWNAFYCCLERFSPAARVRRDNELLIPWPHVWLGGRYLPLAMKGRALPEPAAMAEMARHMMLRGAETFAIWVDAMIGQYPADYPWPHYAAMGQLVYDVVGVQEGYRDMLRFEPFLRRARPMTFALPGRPNELGPDTATWSGMQTAEKALVRTVVFGADGAVPGKIEAFGRTFTLDFVPRGRDYWLFPDGRAEEARDAR